MTNTEKILKGDLVNCHYPFFWLCGGETVQEVVDAVQRVYDSGCDGFTVESRGFKDFEVQWWVLYDALLEKAKSLGLKVIVLDEDWEGPTGHAYGLLNKPENEHLRRKSVLEQHVDVIGPAKIDLVVGKAGCWTPTKRQDDVIGCFAYKRTGMGNEIDIANPIDLTANIKDGILSCEIPEGNYRIMYVFAGARYSEINKDDFIDMLDADSVKLLIDSIYSEYERRYSQYFGNTIIGFFSDEPFIGNAYVFCGNTGKGKHEDTKVGHTGITFPYNNNIKTRLDAIYGCDTTKYFPSLWYWDEAVSPKFRNAYMNIVGDLYHECFTAQVGKWCKDRGLIYIGHVLEDNNLHSRVGDGPGHYFRSQDGQSMPGMDIVLHQIMPGFADIDLGGYGAYIYESEFYHYILGKLHSSAAHTYPAYKGKAMCEVTIGYGWAEGSQLAKWLFDYLLVRGTNFFVPGAIRPKFPDILHAPHFGDNEGREPQFDGYCKILDYSKKVVTALDGTKHICNGAILYHAQAEWMSGDDYMLMQRPAKVLYDAHIDFDILCEDLLDNVCVENGKCKLSETYDCIVVPYAKYLPKTLLAQLTALKEKGADIIFVDGLPEGCDTQFTVVALADVAKYFQKKHYVDVSVDNFPLLRHYHCEKDGVHTYMFFNEHANKTFDGEIVTGKEGNYNVYDFVTNTYYCGGEGNVCVRLEPYQSCIVVYEEDKGFAPYVNYAKLTAKKVQATFTTQLFAYEDMEKCIDTYEQTQLKAVSETKPTFSGKIVYTAKITLSKHKQNFIKFGGIGENAELFVNGVSCGKVICKPFVFDISNAIKDGENDIRIVTYTTLANVMRDPVSMYVPLAPTGVYGDVEILY